MPLPFDDTDYGTLARIAQPQMMGNAPVGGGATAGLMYYQDKARQDDLMQKAAQQAELLARMKQQAAQEYAAGAPGRLADIDVSNATSLNKKANLPTLMDTQNTDIATGNVKSKDAKLNAELDRIGTYAQTYAQAKDSDSKQAVIEMMKRDGVNKIGIRNIDDIPEDRMDKIMKMAVDRQVNTPKFQQQMGIETAKEKAAAEKTNAIIAGAQKKEETRQEGANVRNERSAKAKEYAASLIQKGKEATMKFEDQYKKKAASGETTPEEDAVYRSVLEQQLEVARAKAANSPDQPDLGGMGVKTKPVEQPKVHMPEKPVKQNTNGGKLDLQAGTYTAGTKTLKIVGVKDETGGKKSYKLEDGTIISQ